MASNVPLIRQFSWPSLIPQLAIIGLLLFAYDRAGMGEPFLFAAVTYSLSSLLLRTLLAKSHRQGMRLVKQRRFTEALPCFEKSVDFFSKNAWVDKYRFLALLSASKLSYKEMGLCNIAFCYSQTGKGQKAKEYYEQALQVNPDNGIALAGLNMLTSTENKE